MRTSATDIQTSDQAQSVVQVPGVAPDGTAFKDFILPTSVVVTKQTRADALSLEGVPAEAEQVNIDMRSGQETEWIVIPPHKKKLASITLPTPPSTATLPSTLSARIVALADFTPMTNRSFSLAKRVSVSKPITVTK